MALAVQGVRIPLTTISRLQDGSNSIIGTCQ